MAKKIKKAQSSDLNEDFGLEDSLPPLEEVDTPAGGGTVDLDKYGIWVKGEPEDLTEEQSFDDTEMELEDLSLEEEGMEAVSESDEGMIDNLDLPEEESLSGLEEQDMELEEIPLEQEETEPTVPEAADLSLESGETGDFEDVSLDDLGIDISDGGGAEAAAKQEPVVQEPVSWGRSPAEKEEELVHGDEDFPELALDLEEEDGYGAASGDELAGDLEEEIVFDEGGEAALPDIGEEEELSSLDSLEEIPELEYGREETPELVAEHGTEGEEIEVSLSEDDAIEESDQELGAIGGRLAGPAAAESGSSSILSRIETELRSIKSELTALKSELGMLRGKKAEGGPEPRRKAKKTGDDGKDFFDEEEDETIALTGEELDNILTTADIKEEEESAEQPEDLEEEALDLGEDIISLEDDSGAGGLVLDEAFAEDAELEEAPTEVTVGLDEESGVPELPGDEIEIEIPEFDEGPEHGLESEVPLEVSLDESIEELGELELEADVEDKTKPEPKEKGIDRIPGGLREEIKSVLGYMDHLLESLPEDKIEEFAKSEYFSIYKKLFEELGLVS